MAYISLYRKWRPQSFKELVGQDHVAGTLSNAIKDDRVSHAYLFAGPRGTGKTSTAKILAKSINCEAGPTPEPCGKCDSCKTIGAGHSLDVIEMDAASNRGIEEIRDLRDKVAFAATAARRKVYIIDEVHMLTEPAFNALLKTIEEPPSHVVFVLATTDPQKVPATISSRCQQFEFRRIALSALVTHLGKIAQAEKIKISPEALAVVARHAEGSLRDAIGMLDQLSAYKAQKISEDEVATFLGLPGSAVVEEAVNIIIAGEVGRVFEFVESMTESGRDLRQFTAALLGYARDLFILIHIQPEESRRQLIHRGDEAIERMSKQAEALGAERVRGVLTESGRLFDELRFAAEPRLSVELALIGLIRGEELTLESLAGRITRLEQSGAPRKSEAPAAPISAAAAAGPKPQPRPAPAFRPTSRPEPEPAPEPISASRPEPEPKPVKRPAAGTAVGLSDIEAAWPDILSRAKKKKLSLGAFLVEGRPGAITDGRLTVIFPPKSEFSQQELAKEPNARPFREALAEALGVKLTFTTAVETSGTATAAPPKPATAPPESAIAPPGGESDQKAAAADKNETEDDMIDLLKESFGAEIVD